MRLAYLGEHQAPSPVSQEQDGQFAPVCLGLPQFTGESLTL